MDKNLARIRHERSLRDFPNLRLEDDEYVEFAFMRSKICLKMIFGGMVAGLVVILLGFLLILMGQAMLDEMGRNFLFIILFALLAAAFIIGAVSLRVYRGNRLYITNKHVTQFVMNSLVSGSINIIDLAQIEDASFRQDSLLQKLLHYGTLRLSTIGDETTYTFKYSDISAKDLRAVTKLISEAKKEAGKEA
ncbi:PH domain-containing protein [Candidatus Saccharibacteria bacterium]|nr:PH domain-containing protein [Candidatus Saccharibacteria bacterium]